MGNPAHGRKSNFMGVPWPSWFFSHAIALQPQRSNGIQKAGRQAAQAAVPQGRLRLRLLHPALGLQGDGVGLNYHYGLFRQRFAENKQLELSSMMKSALLSG